MVPFREAIAADVASVMTAHVLYPALDEEQPATLSRTIVTDILRNEFKHKGLIVTDDLDMKGVSGTRSVEEAAIGALRAGCDTLLICSDAVDRHAAVLEAIINAVETNALDRRVVERALRRQERVKSRFLAGSEPARPLSGRKLRARIGTAFNQAVADEMARA